jgi:hypothetical protein
MLPTPTIFMVAMGGLALLSVVVVVSTGSFFSLLVVLILIGILGYTLFKMGYLTIEKTPTGVNVGFFEKTPVPHSLPLNVLPTASLEKKEVFYVGGNDYVYDEAAAVCAAYDADLASYDQVNTAYGAGAEWCGYGWTQGGMALFPTQDKTWQALQAEMDMNKRTGCGRPGVNGGYFDPANKFGVNCYGVKPKGPTDKKFPIPIPPSDPAIFRTMVDKFKGLLTNINISAFNRSGWSKWDFPSFKMPEQTK